MLVPLDSASIWLFWDGDGAFENWYVNLERLTCPARERLRHRDMLLDVVCDASGRWRWKDEDELELAVAVGAITREGRGGAEGERVVAAIERWASPFADGWERWRRIRTGRRPGPADWDA